MRKYLPSIDKGGRGKWSDLIFASAFVFISEEEPVVSDRREEEDEEDETAEKEADRSASAEAAEPTDDEIYEVRVGIVPTFSDVFSLPRWGKKIIWKKNFVMPATKIWQFFFFIMTNRLVFEHLFQKEKSALIIWSVHLRKTVQHLLLIFLYLKNFFYKKFKIGEYQNTT